MGEQIQTATRQQAQSCSEENRTPLHAAVLKAADHIEANPREYQFSQTEIPTCGTPGCAIGWIHHFSGIGGDKTEDYNLIEAKNLFSFCFDDDDFYVRMDAVADDAWAWRGNATACAKTLRKFAARYVP